MHWGGRGPFVVSSSPFPPGWMGFASFQCQERREVKQPLCAHAQDPDQPSAPGPWQSQCLSTVPVPDCESGCGVGAPCPAIPPLPSSHEALLPLVPNH